MFAKTIIDSDAFLDMPMSARLLYYDLSMRADDEGFVNSPKKIMRMVGASMDDLNILALKKFVIPFESGVVVIKHWKIHNYIRRDMFHETKYKEERGTLMIDENGAYTMSVTTSLQDCNEPVTNPSTQVRLGKDRVGKDNKEKSKKEKTDVFADFAGDDKELLNALNEFEKMRNSIKKPMTDRAKTIMLSKLSDLPKSDWIAILDQSISHCWQSVYALHRDDSKPSGSPSYDLEKADLQGYNLDPNDLKG